MPTETAFSIQEEWEVLRKLDEAVGKESVRKFLDAAVERTARKLSETPNTFMTWEAIPLPTYDVNLPAMIRSSWLFLLRSGTSTGAEKHPNSRQRMMSYRGQGDLQTRTGENWRSHRLKSDPLSKAEERWISIPPNMWHQAVVVPGPNWAVVSFHTVPPEELIEERPDPADPDLTRRRRYSNS